MRRLYDWVLGWADHRYGGLALFVVAFAESSFFPIPPDLLLIALAVAAPLGAFRYAAICTAGSVLGGLFGYFLGAQFFDLVGGPLVRFYSAEDQYEWMQNLYREHDAFAVAVAGVTPIPYKVATITAGFFGVDLPRFVLASALSRSLRFFAIGALIRFFGPAIKAFIDRYFEILSILFLVMLVGGFVLLRWLAG
jgi:membrane protein YqaA with SNARE-associated domain